MAQIGTRKRILKEARGLLQRFGFNGFSFQHVADAVGIKKPSIYDHFESKEVLGNAVIAQYRDGFGAWTESVAELPAREQIRSLFEFLANFSRRHYKFCPIAMLTADLQTLPPSMRRAIFEFHERQLAWLTALIKKGIKEGEFRPRLTAEDAAEMVITISLGAQQVARLRKDPEFVARAAVRQVFNCLE